MLAPCEPHYYPFVQVTPEASADLSTPSTPLQAPTHQSILQLLALLICAPLFCKPQLLEVTLVHVCSTQEMHHQGSVGPGQAFLVSTAAVVLLLLLKLLKQMALHSTATALTHHSWLTWISAWGSLLQQQLQRASTGVSTPASPLQTLAACVTCISIIPSALSPSTWPR